ncbi:retroviral-like aspartic protease family protein, partial [Salmonella enterica]|nr:retroviral-like aspartic protease family protein [Salmonella enterica]
MRTTEKMLEYAKIPETEMVTCATFMFQKAAGFWWDTMRTIHDVPSMTWNQFRELFYDKYFPEAVRVNKRTEFASLKQGKMSVTEYTQKFDELSRFAPHMVGTNELKVEHFLQGIQKEILRDLRIGGVKNIPFSEIVSRALIAEQAEAEIREQRKAEKSQLETERQRVLPPRPNYHPHRGQHHRGGHFRGGQYRGDRGRGPRPQHSQPPQQSQPSQHPPHNKRKEAPAQDSRSEQKKPYHSDQRTSTTRTPCTSCGIAHWGECRRVTGACFKCGKTNHQIKDCPELKNEPKKTNARLFALGGDGAEADPSVITGDVPISGIMTRVLIDSGATHSFASERFVRRLGQVPDRADSEFSTVLPSGEIIRSDQILVARSVVMGGREMFVDLIVLDMPYYEVILGMDWLSKYHAKIDCERKTVVFSPPGEDQFVFVGTRHQPRIPMISAMRASRLLEAGCVGYLASIVDASVEQSLRPED